jgi:hypothetical protein
MAANTTPVYSHSVKDRAPMLRGKAPDRVSAEMDLPEGKTCADCIHCRRCCLIFGHIPEDQVCDWHPSRFVQKGGA